LIIERIEGHDQPLIMEQITLPGVIESLGHVSIFLNEASLAAGLDQRSANRLHVAVDELVTNIVIHGYEEHGLSGEVTLAREISADRLVIHVEDSAPPFDPQQLDQRTNLDKSVEDRKVGGVGIYLMLKVLHAYFYEYRDGKNRSTLVMKRGASENLNTA
jgi:anti-sigma regulatory factor (Ser/Thr protein kinase)